MEEFYGINQGNFVVRGKPSFCEKSSVFSVDIDIVVATQMEATGNGSVRKVMSPPTVRIVPPLNFCPVEANLYRSGQPSVINQSFLNQLNLKTILWLASEEPTDEFLEYCNSNGINIEFVGINNDNDHDHISSLNPWDALDEQRIKRALELIVDINNYPLLVCCGMGRHRTGTVIGCLRRLQGWNLASVSEEYRRFTGARGGRIQVELLMENFDINSVQICKDKVPKWLLPRVQDATS